MKKATTRGQGAPSEAITRYIEQLADWRGLVIGRLRKIIRDAAPDLVENWKWGTPVWTRNGNVVAVGAFKQHVKLNFFDGAALEDRHGLFNAGLDAKATRAIDLAEGEKLNEAALKDLIRAAAAYDAKRRPAK